MSDAGLDDDDEKTDLHGQVGTGEVAKWEKAKRVNVVARGQSQITGYFSELRRRRQTTKRAGGAEMSGDDQPSTGSAASAATAARPAAAMVDQSALWQREMTEFGPGASKRARVSATGDGAVSEAPSALLPSPLSLPPPP